MNAPDVGKKTKRSVRGVMILDMGIDPFPCKSCKSGTMVVFEAGGNLLGIKYRTDMNDNGPRICPKADWEGYASINRIYAEMIDFHEQLIKKTSEKSKKSRWKMSEY